MTLAFSSFFALWLGFMGTMFAAFPAPAPMAGPDGAAAAQAMQGPPAVFFAVLLVLGVAIPRLVFLPYGIILSLFTLLVLERRSVRDLYLTGLERQWTPTSTG